MARIRKRRAKDRRAWLLPVLGVAIIGVIAALWTLVHPAAGGPEIKSRDDDFAAAIRNLAARHELTPDAVTEDDPIRKKGEIFVRTWRLTVPRRDSAVALASDLVAEASRRGMDFEHLKTGAGEIENLRIDGSIEAFDIRFSVREKRVAGKEKSAAVYFSPTPVPRSSRRQDSGPKRGRMAILLDDTGQNMDLVGSAARLPKEVGFAVLPFLPASSSAAKALHRAGHEIWLHLPMEPAGFPDEDPGPGAVFLTMSEKEIRETLHRAVDDIPHVVGVNNHMGSRATTDLRAMTWVMQEIKGRGLAFIDSRTAVDTIAEDAARAQGVPTGRRHVFLDNERSETAVRAQLEQAVYRALTGEDVIAIGHFATVTVEVLSEEGPRLQDRGVILVRPTEILN